MQHNEERRKQDPEPLSTATGQLDIQPAFLDDPSDPGQVVSREVGRVIVKA
jgi:hypothetical protein